MGEVEELAGVTTCKCSRATRDGKREATVDAKKQWKKAAAKVLNIWARHGLGQWLQQEHQRAEGLHEEHLSRVATHSHL